MRVSVPAGRPSLFSPRLVPVFAVLAVAALCPACSSNRRAVHPVHGQVLVDGKPVAQAQVLFHPSADAPDGLRPTGQTDDEGHFTLTSYAKNDGAPEGDYTVTVTWFRLFRTGPQKGADVVSQNVLPKRYASPQTSRLKVSVAKGANELPPLRLTSR